MLPPVMDNSIFSLHKSLQQKKRLFQKGYRKMEQSDVKRFYTPSYFES